MEKKYMNENKKMVEHGPKGLKRIPIGISDYRKLKTGDYYIVDKSLLIKEFLDKIPAFEGVSKEQAVIQRNRYV